jgi:hypothetical protein
MKMEGSNVGKYATIDTASYTKILEFSSRVLLEPQCKFLFLLSCSKLKRVALKIYFICKLSSNLNYRYIYTNIITFGLIIEIMAILFSSTCFNKFISTLVQIICDFKVLQHPDMSPFKHIRKISKNDYSFFISVFPAICRSFPSHGTTRLPPDEFSWNSISEHFSKICR